MRSYCGNERLSDFDGVDRNQYTKVVNAKSRGEIDFVPLMFPLSRKNQEEMETFKAEYFFQPCFRWVLVSLDGKAAFNINGI